MVRVNFFFSFQSFSFFLMGQPDNQATRHPFTVFAGIETALKVEQEAYYSMNVAENQGPIVRRFK